MTLQRRYSDGALSPRLFERVTQAGHDETIPALRMRCSTPLATQQVKIDLDDGVKVNYNKLGRALAHVGGLTLPTPHFPLPTTHCPLTR